MQQVSIEPHEDMINLKSVKTFFWHIHGKNHPKSNAKKKQNNCFAISRKRNPKESCGVVHFDTFGAAQQMEKNSEINWDQFRFGRELLEIHGTVILGSILIGAIAEV